MSLLDYNWLFIKEQVRFLRISNVYDVYDQNQNKIGAVKEKTNFLKKLLGKYTLEFYDKDDRLLFTAKKPFAFIKKKVFIYDSNSQLLGHFYKKIIALIPQFLIFSREGQQIGLLKGDFFAWNFQIEDMQKKRIALINKIFSGALREFFTTADSYQIMIYEPKSIDKRLLIAAPFVVDIIMKEEQGRKGGLRFRGM